MVCVALDGRSAKIRQQLLAEGKEPQPYSFEEHRKDTVPICKARHPPEEGQGPGGWCSILSSDSLPVLCDSTRL